MLFPKEAQQFWPKPYPLPQYDHQNRAQDFPHNSFAKAHLLLRKKSHPQCCGQRYVLNKQMSSARQPPADHIPRIAFGSFFRFRLYDVFLKRIFIHCISHRCWYLSAHTIIPYVPKYDFSHLYLSIQDRHADILLDIYEVSPSSSLRSIGLFPPTPSLILSQQD